MSCVTAVAGHETDGVPSPLWDRTDHSNVTVDLERTPAKSLWDGTEGS